MVQRELGYKLTAQVDRASMVATKKEFRDAAKEIDRAKTSTEKFNEEQERLANLQRKGLISQEVVGRRSADLRRQQMREVVAGLPGGSQLAGLLGPRSMLVGSLAGLTAIMTLVHQSLSRDKRILGRAAALGVDPGRLDALRRDLQKAPVAEDVIEQAVDKIADKAFLRGVTPDVEARRIQDLMRALPDRRSRALFAEQELGSRAWADRFGDLTFDNFQRYRPRPFEDIRVIDHIWRLVKEYLLTGPQAPRGTIGPLQGMRPDPESNMIESLRPADGY